MARPLCKCGLCARGLTEEHAPEDFVADVVRQVVRRYPDGDRRLEAAIRMGAQLGWSGRHQLASHEARS